MNRNIAPEGVRKRKSGCWQRRQGRRNAREELNMEPCSIITILSLCGVAYNVWAVVAASGDSLWENILYDITCLFCFMIGLLALHYDRR